MLSKYVNITEEVWKKDMFFQTINIFIIAISFVNFYI